MKFVWQTTQDNVDYTIWAAGKPNEGHHMRDCAELFQPFNFQWYYAPCSTMNNFICEKTWVHFIISILKKLRWIWFVMLFLIFTSLAKLSSFVHVHVHIYIHSEWSVYFFLLKLIVSRSSLNLTVLTFTIYLLKPSFT